MFPSWIAALVLLPVLVDGASHRPALRSAGDKVRRLLADVELGVLKGGEDEELVFGTLDNYDQQLEKSLSHEIGTLNQTLAKLYIVRQKCHDELTASQSELTHLGAVEEGHAKRADSFSANAAKEGTQFDDLMESTGVLQELLRTAAIDSNGLIVTGKGESHKNAEVQSAVRRLLTTASPELKNQFGDVFRAFGPSNDDAGASQLQLVRLTPALLTRTVDVLQAVHETLDKQKSQALLQLETGHRRSEGKAKAASASLSMQEGVQAENEQQAEELSFSIKFTEAVLKIDSDFQAKVQKSVKAKSLLLRDIRTSQQNQQKMLKDLTDLLNGKFTVPTAGEDVLAVEGTSFLQTESQSPRKKVALMQSAIEIAISKHQDTHNILMNIKNMLDANEPIDAAGVQRVVNEMANALHSVQAEQTRVDDAKRRCQSQKFNAGEQEQALSANLGMMYAARNHTEAAIRAAKHNTQGMKAKVNALEKSLQGFAGIAAQAMKSLDRQSRDRNMIMMAVQKASESASTQQISAGLPAAALLQQLTQELAGQESKEHTYKQEAASFETSFLQYVHGYVELLNERQSHYQASLSALELYASELSVDSVAQAGASGESDSLEKEGEDLCKSIMHYYAAHTKRRRELTNVLKAVIPQIPETLSAGIEAEDGDEEGDAQ